MEMSVPSGLLLGGLRQLRCYMPDGIYQNGLEWLFSTNITCLRHCLSAITASESRSDVILVENRKPFQLCKSRRDVTANFLIPPLILIKCLVLFRYNIDRHEMRFFHRRTKNERLVKRHEPAVTLLFGFVTDQEVDELLV